MLSISATAGLSSREAGGFLSEDKDPFSLPGRGGLSGLAGKTTGWQAGHGLQGLQLRIPDQLSCCSGGWASCLAGFCLPISKVRVLVTKSQRWREALRLASTWRNLSPQVHTGLAWGAVTEVWGPLRETRTPGLQDGLDTRNCKDSPGDSNAQPS